MKTPLQEFFKYIKENHYTLSGQQQFGLTYYVKYNDLLQIEKQVILDAFNAGVEFTGHESGEGIAEDYFNENF